MFSNSIDTEIKFSCGSYFDKSNANLGTPASSLATIFVELFGDIQYFGFMFVSNLKSFKLSRSGDNSVYVPRACKEIRT
jgi:hypothetical protein